MVHTQTDTVPYKLYPTSTTSHIPEFVAVTADAHAQLQNLKAQYGLRTGVHTTHDTLDALQHDACSVDLDGVVCDRAEPAPLQ